MIKHIKSDLRDLDSMGAVGAAAPTDFEESSLYNLNFIQKSQFLERT